MIFSLFDKFTINKEAEKLALAVGLQKGWKIAEVGAGDGKLVEQMCGLTGENGAVFAAESDPGKLANLTKLGQKQNLLNLKVIFSNANASNLPDQTFNLIVVRKAYHHFINPAEMNGSFFKALMPGGQLVIIDFTPKWYLRLSTPTGIPKNRGGHGINQDLAINEIVSAGFKLKQQIHNWAKGGLYCLIFKK